MLSIRSLSLASFACLALGASGANAGLTATWNEVTASATPSGYRSFDLQCTLTGSDDFQSARLFTTGSFYQDSFGGNTAPNPALISVFPALAFDTYVTSPGTTPATTVLGGFDGTNESATATFDATTLGIVWGDLVTSSPGTYALARLTYTGTTPTLSGRISFGTPGSGTSNSISLPQLAPEPSSLAVIGVGSIATMRRQHRRRHQQKA